MSRDLYYEPDRLFLPAELIFDLVQTERTPVYLYNADGIQETSRRIFDAFSWNAGFRQYVPLKAVNAPGVLKLLLKSGQGLLCSTGLELELARRVGAKPEQILFVPICPTMEDLRRAAEEDFPTVIDSEQMTKDLLRLEKLPRRLGLRYHPEHNIDVGTRTVARTEGSKYGLDTLELIAVTKRLMQRGVTEIGLHIHLKSGVENVRYWGKLLKVLHTAAQKVQTKTGIQIAYYDLGGGMLPPKPKDPQDDLPAVADYVRICAEELQIDLPVYTEFGRYAVGPHGILVSRVYAVKPYYEEQRPLVLLDAGVSKLFKHVGNHMQFHVSVVGRCETAGRAFYSLAGATADHLDRIAGRFLLPKLQAGELVAFQGAGAYCASLDSNLFGTLRSAVYLYENGALTCLRRAETEEEYFRHMIF